MGVDEAEPDAYPGWFIEAEHEDLLDTSSPIIRAIPTGVDVLVMYAGIGLNAVAEAVHGRPLDSTR